MNPSRIRFAPLIHLPSLRALVLAFLLIPLVPAVCQAGGVVIAWGDNNDSQAQVPPGLTNATAVAGGNVHSLSLKTDGTVVAWGFDFFGQATVPPGLTNVVALSGGQSYSLALKSDGTVVGWGIYSSAPAGVTNVTAIAAGWSHSLALKRDGTIVAWGSQSVVPDGLSNVVAIAAGKGQSLALRADGSVAAWGDNSFGKATVPAGLSNVTAIAGGQDHSLALKLDGTIVAWGGNSHGQTNVPPSLTNVVAIAAGAFHGLALKSDGTLAAWGDNTYNQAVVPGLSNMFAIAAGGFHNLALRGDGSPIILVQPASQTAGITKDATFQVMAIGSPAPSFRWQRNGIDIAGATNSVLVLRNVQMSDAGSFTVVVSNSVASVTSAAAILTPVGIPPFVTVPPQDQTAICGEGAAFSVAADGSSPFTYQWQFEGTPLPGATTMNLVLSNVSNANAGHYAAVVANAFGSITSSPAILTVLAVPPQITSPLTAPAKQGQPFSYTITAVHSPISFGASRLPPGLTLDTATGLISGIPLESGTFGPTITAFNACTSESETLVITILPSVPAITSSLIASGTEGSPFSYQITATESPGSFGAQPLPLGLTVDPATGIISGQPVYAGDFFAAISATNTWGSGAATLHFIFTNAVVSGLSLADVAYTYSSPYLLDFEFSLRDNADPTVGHSVVAKPVLLSASCMEDGVPISASETAFIIDRAASKQFKSYLVLDFTESIASLANGDTNNNGISDAIEAMVAGAEDFVDQQQPGNQVGVYEFHREDVDPQRVVALTTDKNLLDQAIAGIWTNYVQGFPAGSRAWDALVAAITDLGPTNADEQHFVVFVSDGNDESSLSTITDVITAATNGNVKIFCIGFGRELNPAPLLAITSATSGRYYDAQSFGGLTAAFDAIGKDLNGRYLLRWATLRRSTNSFMPSFQIFFQGLNASSPGNPVTTTTNIDNSTTPPTTNVVSTTNIIIAPYVPSEHTGSVTVGSLRLVANADVLPESITLRAFYVPRYIRQLRIHYRANWPCTPSLLSTDVGEILYGWSLTETNDGAGGKWLQIASPNPQSLSNSIPFGALGNLIKFSLRDMVDATNAFSLFDIDNTIYTNTGRQSFVLQTNSFIINYPVLPFGTPVPWLIAHGFPNNFVAAELSDPDGDGALTWQEYRANTDPRNPNSKFVVRSLVQGFDGRYQVTFSSSLNRIYRVESSPDLFNWQTLQDNIAGTGADVTFIDTRYLPGVARLFFRIAVY